MMRSFVNAFVGICICLMGCCTWLIGQVPTAEILGTVTDNTGSVVPNATVTVKNLGTGETRAAMTNTSGDYAFTLLQIGTYSVTIERPGFKKQSIASVTLSSGDRSRVDAKLELGAVEQTVEVSAQATALQTDNATLGGLVTEQSVQSLPLNGRNFINLAQLAPGASEGNPQGFSSGTRPDDRRQSSQITVNAQNDSVNNKTIDGMDNNEAVIGTVGVQPSIDAIQEVRVQTNLYTAEVGRTAGAVVDIITKSGTNQFHGSAYEFLRNKVFDARDYFDTAQVGAKPQLVQNQFGGSVGGPIVKDKTFFFADYEGMRRVQQLAVPLATVPTACQLGRASCNGVTQLGNFSDLKTTIFDPVTGVAFPNNVIPLDRISSVAQNFAALYPSPNLPGAISAATGQPSNNYASTPKRTQFSTTTDTRIDHHIGVNDTLMGRYTLNDVATQTPGNLPAVQVAGLLVQPGGDTGGTVNAFAGGSQERAQNTALVYTHIFNPQTVMQLNAGYLRVSIFSTPLNFGSNAATKFGLNGINDPSIAGGFATALPLINLSGYTNIGDDNFLPLKYIDNTYQYNGNITWNSGSHVVKFGGGLSKRGFAAVQSQFPNGNYVFDQTPTSAQSATAFTGSQGNSFASLLLGYPRTVNRNLSLTAPYYSTWEPNAYVQDNWRVRSWLTLNLGVRWDLFTPWTEKHNLISNFNPATGLLEPATDQNRTASVQTVYHDFAPRAGFAATLGHGAVLRGGGGLTYFPGRYASFFQLKNPPFTSAFQSSLSTNKANFASAPTFASALPSPAATPTTCGNPATILNCPSQQINAIDPDWQPSRVFQASLQLQKDFRGNVIGVGWVGVFGRDLNVAVDLNELNTPGPQPAGTALLGGSPQATQPYASTYPLIAVINQQKTVGSSAYNGLEVTFERRLQRGLTVNANYTWGHEIDNTIYPGFGLYSACPPGYNCIVDRGNGTTSTVKGLNYDQGNGAYDVRHRVVVALNYQLPSGKNKHGFLDHAFGGWQLNSLVTYSTGLPFTVQEGASTMLSQMVGTGGNTPGSRPNVTGSTSVNNPNPTSWFNIGAFSAQQIGTLGNLGRDAMTAPPLRHWDASVFKDFRVTERSRIQFRFEVFNLTNTPNFAAPISTISGWTNVNGPNTGTPTSAGGFGTITSTAANATPRQMQFALKFLF